MIVDGFMATLQGTATASWGTGGELGVVLFLPAVGAAVLALMKADEKRAIRAVALLTGVLTFAVSLPIGIAPPGPHAFSVDWIPSLGIRFALGADGVSAWLIMLTNLLVPITLLASYNRIKRNVKEFYVAALLLHMTLLGVFMAQDLFLFYVMFEATLIPAFFIIGGFGGDNRAYAALKYVLYAALGSLVFLASLLLVYVTVWDFRGAPTFDIATITQAYADMRASGQVQPGQNTLLFIGFALAFAIRAPLFPLHAWFPDAQAEGPSPGAMLLAGALIKTGLYGFYKLAIPIFPNAAEVMAVPMIIMSLIGIAYGALMAFSQTDITRMLAYASISTVGYCLLGLFVYNAAGWDGAMILSLAHGVTAAALFMLAGMLKERTQTTEMGAYGGLASTAPKLTVAFIIMILAAVGIPLTGGFSGVFPIVIGAFNHSATAGALAVAGVMLNAIYLIWMAQRVFFGPVENARVEHFQDLTVRETVCIVPLILVILMIGLFPNVLTHSMNADVAAGLNAYSKAVNGGENAKQGVDPFTGRADAHQTVHQGKPFGTRTPPKPLKQFGAREHSRLSQQRPRTPGESRKTVNRTEIGKVSSTAP